MRLWQLAAHQASRKSYLSLKTFRGPNQKTLLPRAKCSLPFFLGFYFFHPICFRSPSPSRARVRAHTLPRLHRQCGAWHIPKPCPWQSNVSGSRSCKSACACRSSQPLSRRAGWSPRTPGPRLPGR